MPGKIVKEFQCDFLETHHPNLEAVHFAQFDSHSIQLL